MKHLLTIGNSITVFFSILLTSSILLIIFFNVDNGKVYYSDKQFPKIEINDFTLYQIDNKNLILQLNAVNAKQYDMFEEFSHIIMKRYVNNEIDTISAPNAIKKGNILFFNDGLGYDRGGYIFHTQEGVYSIDDGILKGNKSFSIKNEYQNILGNNIYYDSKKGLIKAYDIKAEFESKK